MRYADIRTQLTATAEGTTPGDGSITKALKELAASGLVEKRGPRSRDDWALTKLGEDVVADVVKKVKVLADPNATGADGNDEPTGPSSPSGSAATVALTSTAQSRRRTGLNSPEEQPAIDTTMAHPARRYNYWLGGKDNFKVDRDSADEIKAFMPTVELAALENRGFLDRAVRFLSGLGIRQFLDVGSGIPTSPNVHETAQAFDPTARVVYVDNDPYVLALADALLTSTPQGKTAYIDGDLRQPQTILDTPELRSTLDLSKPVGLLLVAVLHFIRDDENPRTILSTLVDALPPGSWVVASHGTWEYLSLEDRQQLQALNRDGRFQARSSSQLADLLGNLELHAPGIQSVTQWWAEDAPKPRPSANDVAVNGAVARVVRDR